MILKNRKPKEGQAKKISIMDHPEYKIEWDRLMALRTRLTEAEKALNDIADSRRNLPERIREAHREVLEETIRGGDPRRVDLVENLREEAETIRAQIRGLKEAEQEQRKRVDEARSKVSQKILRDLKPLDRELAHAIAVGFIEWCKLRIARIDFLNELEAGNVAFSYDFEPIAPHYGDPSRNPNSNAALLLMEFVDRGYLEPGEIPKEWRDAWHRSGGITLRGMAV